MTCKLKFEYLSRYIDKACSLQEKEKMDLHLKECQECRHEFSNLRLLKQTLSSLTSVKESEDFDFVFNQKLKTRLEEKVSVSLNEVLKDTLSGIREAFMPKTPVFVKVAASLVVALALLFGSYSYYTYTSMPFIESADGEVSIYKGQAEKWIIAKANMRLGENYIIKTSNTGIVNIISKDKYAARIKEGSYIKIAKLNVKGRNHFTEFDITSGELMVNTRDAFKGSNMLLKTAACQGKVVGTAFAVDVDESSQTTWLGVLEGKVKVSSHGRDVYVDAGQKTETRTGNAPDIPTILTDNEWRLVQELYQLGEKPQVVLLVSMRADRVEELLKPAPLYILDTTPRTIPKDLEAIINIINRAIEDNDIEAHKFSIENLERLVKVHPNPKYNAQFLMFIGSYYYYIGDYKKAIDTFKKVVTEYPDYALSSLAQCAVATIYQRDLKDDRNAKISFEVLLKKYPDSIDAPKAREFLKI